LKLYSIIFENALDLRFRQPNLTGKKTTIDELQQHFAHFHLSRGYLGKTFKFTPRVPSAPFIDKDGNTIEDDFTERISLAADIEDARDAIRDYGDTYYYIYATKEKKEKEIKPVKDNLPNCPKNPPKKYGVKFNMQKWLKKNHPQEIPRLEKRGFGHNFPPSALAPDIKQQFQGCVPDAAKTHEEWSLKPLTMLFVGTIGEAGDVLELSEAGAEIMGL
jgi:hypothetical protein